MANEQLLIYLLLGGFALLQFLAGALKRRRERETGQPSAPEPDVQEPDEHWWSPVPENALPEVRVEVTPAPIARRAHAAVSSAARPRPPEPPKPSPARVEASRHRIALRNRTELRRAVELMAILGPPRSRVPFES